MQTSGHTSAPILPEPRKPLARAPRKGWPTVAELSARLYAAYQVDGGSIHLGGCALEPQAIVHAQGICANVGGGAGEEPVELFLFATGEMIDDQLTETLGLTDLVPAEKPPRLSVAEQNHLVSAGEAALEKACNQMGGQLVESSKAIEIVWCRWAAGKLRFSIGNESVDLPFADWSVRLKAPPYVCPISNLSTYHLAATDDGRIVAAEAIARCEKTGKRTVSGELRTCAATGVRVAQELTVRCPATQQIVVKEALTPCPVCLLPVAPAAILDGQCRACQTSQVSVNDPRMRLLLGEFPAVGRWRNLRLAETPTAYVLQSRGLLRRLLAVFEKNSLAPLRVAERSPFRKTWVDLPRDRWSEVLGASRPSID